MFDGKRSHRGCLLAVAAALVAAMVGAFALTSASATANPAAVPVGKVTSMAKAMVTVTHLEVGMEGTAYQYMKVNWNDTANQPGTPEYLFNDEVAGWLKKNKDFKDYIDDEGGPTVAFRELNSAAMRGFCDQLLAAIARNQVNLTAHQAVGRAAASSGSADSDNAQLSFHLPMGGYVIGLSNGVSRVYQPVGAYIRPRYDEAARGYRLEVGDVDGTASDTDFDAKSKEITSTKTVNTKKKVHSQIGDTLNFEVTTPIPHYPDGALNKKFGVQDHPHPGLTIDTSSIEVRIDGEKLTQGADYTMGTLDAATDGKRGPGFKVEFNTDQYRRKLAEAGKKGRKLTVAYKGMLNRAAPIAGGADNRAQPLIMTNNYSPEGKYTDPLPRPALTTVYTYGVRLTKVDSRYTSKKLQGAQFRLYRAGEGGGGEVRVQPKPDGAATGMYVVEAGAADGGAPITTGENGLLQIDGLGAGVYTLQEVKAPDGGYALPNRPIEIEIKDEQTEGEFGGKSNEPDGKPDKTSKIGGRFATLDSSDNRLTHILTNRKADFSLPETGALGAVIFGVIGVALVATSVVFAVIHRCRRKAKRSL